MTLATCPAPFFGTTVEGGRRTLLKRQRGVVAVAPAACSGAMTVHEPLASPVITADPSALPPAQKRSRVDLDEIAPELPRAERLKQRMEAKLGAARALLAAHLPRDAPTGGAATGRKQDDDVRMMAAKRRQDQAPSAADEAAKRRKTSSSPNPAAVHHQRPVKKPVPQAHHHQRNEARKPQPTTGKQHETKAAADAIHKAKEIARDEGERRRLEEIARERERFRQELLEVEKAAMPDETLYAEDLEELGITTAVQYAVTRTRKQALRAALLRHRSSVAALRSQ